MLLFDILLKLRTMVTFRNKPIRFFTVQFSTYKYTMKRRSPKSYT